MHLSVFFLKLVVVPSNSDSNDDNLIVDCVVDFALIAPAFSFSLLDVPVILQLRGPDP
jgi:hypothetical protein